MGEERQVTAAELAWEWTTSMVAEQDRTVMQDAGDAAVPLIMQQIRAETARVLTLDSTPELLVALQATGADVVQADGTAGVAELHRALGDGHFEIIVALALEAWADPMATLQALSDHLQLGGALIVAWRNPAHLGLRLALLHGRLILDGQGTQAGLPPRLYSAREAEHLFAEAGFTLASLDRQTSAQDQAHIFQAHPGVSGELLHALAQDPEAETVRFIATIRPRQWADPEDLAARLRETQGPQDALATTVVELRQALNERTERLAALEAALARAEQREQEAREQLATETERNLDQLRLSLDGQMERLGALAAQMELVAGRTTELGALLLGTANGVPPASAMQSTLGALLAPRRDPLPPAARSDPHRYRLYQQVIHRIRGIVRSVIPDGATVIVISKGDDELLRLDGKQGWHFPRLAQGVYAGFYPEDSAAAISHLEELRAAGGGYLLIPETALWWLDHYVEFRHHLEGKYRRVISRRQDGCVIFDLQTAEPGV